MRDRNRLAIEQQFRDGGVIPAAIRTNYEREGLLDLQEWLQGMEYEDENGEFCPILVKPSNHQPATLLRSSLVFGLVIKGILLSSKFRIRTARYSFIELADILERDEFAYREVAERLDYLFVDYAACGYAYPVNPGAGARVRQLIEDFLIQGKGVGVRADVPQDVRIDEWLSEPLAQKLRLQGNVIEVQPCRTA